MRTLRLQARVENELLKVSRRPDGSPEIFHSIQGEGSNIGKPAVFLRLCLCNLACVWCDTKYTWDWEQYEPKEQMIEMSDEDVENEIMQHNCKHLIVTGGEPTLQQKHLIHLLRHLRDRGFTIEIETNGTIVPDSEIVTSVQHWNVSPKLESSGNLRLKREVSQVYEFFRRLSSANFKYVVNDESDFAEIQSLVSKYNLDPEKVILMPQAHDSVTLLERSRWLVELCVKEGYRFSTRLQVLLWGNARGI